MYLIFGYALGNKAMIFIQYLLPTFFLFLLVLAGIAPFLGWVASRIGIFDRISDTTLILSYFVGVAIGLVIVVNCY